MQASYSTLNYPVEDAYSSSEVAPFVDVYYPSTSTEQGGYQPSEMFPGEFTLSHSGLRIAQGSPEDFLVRHSPAPSTNAPTPALQVDNPDASPYSLGTPKSNSRDPAGLGKRKRKVEEDSGPETALKRPRKSIPSYTNSELNEEERLLLQLKDQQLLTWKDIQFQFQQTLSRSYQVPALQMRYKRLREKLRPWTEIDVSENDKPWRARAREREGMEEWKRGMANRSCT